MVNRITPPQARAASFDIGGAICRRLIERGGEVWKRPGDPLTEEEVLSIPRANLVALRDSGYLQIYPKAARAIAPEIEKIATTRFAIHRGCGKYDVIEGIQLNEKQLTKDEAFALVGQKDAPTEN